ncbi:transcription factor iiib 50 kda subunit-like [Plakobranchus ocellatus]|uniref:Transcription factor IIIB 50 kDa subunit n=1 Tax=Plakobranchus ocellatus TaxID=259542 RepID=A0AAV3YN15_9GAST|nr:transcription factor iiib 50 kda subunit-like [Plakobranchus ocellatus]
MPLKCQFCGESSVVEEDVGDGREQLICVECGTVATSTASQVEEVSSATTLQEDSQQDTDGCDLLRLCQSCGDSLQPGETYFCLECKDLEEDPEKDADPKVGNSSKAFETQVHDLPRQKHCPSCGSLDLVTDSLGAEEQTVCRQCGQVIGGDTLTNDEPEQSLTRTIGNRARTLPKYSRLPGECYGYKMGMRKIMHVHHKLGLSGCIREKAESMFGQLFYLPFVINKTVQSKENIATACVYIACRQDNLPVSMVHFVEYVDSSKHFFRAIKIALSQLNIKLQNQALGSQVSQTFHSVQLSRENVDATHMLHQVRDIMFLCREAWLTSGRHYQPMILVAIYYVYLKSECCPRTISLAKFCSQFKLPTISKKIVSDFQKLFLRLAAHLPWAKPEQLKPSTIHLYIDDILKYKKSLMHLAFEIPEAGKECSPWETEPGAQGSAQKDILMPVSFKRARLAKPMEKIESTIPSHLDLDCPEIKPTDFSEEEISSYLLSPEEYNSVKEAKENVCQKQKRRLT